MHVEYLFPFGRTIFKIKSYQSSKFRKSQKKNLNILLVQIFQWSPETIYFLSHEVLTVFHEPS